MRLHRSKRSRIWVELTDLIAGIAVYPADYNHSKPIGITKGLPEVKYVMWLLKAAIFFTLFAFALNNQQIVAVHFFFGTLWNAPLVLVVLTAFTCGLSLGVLVMIPRWWTKKKAVPDSAAGQNSTAQQTSSASTDEPLAPPHGI